MTYIKIYSAEEFKDLTNCNRILVKQCQDSGILYFTYGANIGYVYLNSIPKEPVISIVVNSSGKIFPLLMEKSDILKSTLPIIKHAPKEDNSDTVSNNASVTDTDNWSDPYGDEKDFYDGWNREEVENGLADAYEGDADARWNND